MTAPRTTAASAARRTIGLRAAADKLRAGGAEGAALAADVARAAGYSVVGPDDTPTTAEAALDAAIDATGRMHGDPQPDGEELLAALARLGYVVTPATPPPPVGRCGCNRHIRILWSGPIDSSGSRPIVAVCNFNPAHCDYREPIPNSDRTIRIIPNPLSPGGTHHEYPNHDRPG